MERAAINIEALKRKHNEDSLPFHMWCVALDCKRRRDAFWRHYKSLKLYAGLITVPMILTTSVTGLTSVAHLGTAIGLLGTPNKPTNELGVPIAVTVFSVTSAVLTALQKYFGYSERAEHAKHLAKTYGRIARRIENTMILVESEAITMQPEAFLKFLEDIQKDIDSLMQETDDVPAELVAQRPAITGTSQNRQNAPPQPRISNPNIQLAPKKNSFDRKPVPLLHTNYAAPFPPNRPRTSPHLPRTTEQAREIVIASRGQPHSHPNLQSVRGAVIGGTFADIAHPFSTLDELGRALSVLSEEIEKETDPDRASRLVAQHNALSQKYEEVQQLPPHPPQAPLPGRSASRG